MLYILKRRITAPIKIGRMRIHISRRALGTSITLAIKLSAFPPSNDINNPNYSFSTGDTDIRNRPIDIVMRDNNEIIKFHNCMLYSYHETDITQPWTFAVAHITFPRRYAKSEMFVALKNTAKYGALVYNDLRV